MGRALFDRIPIILAPMAGVTDHAFRIICADHGADMCVTEMISAKAVQFNDKKTYDLARIGEDECPCALQLFGSDADIIADSARRLVDHARCGNGAVPLMLDINMGCPVKKVAGNGEGSALMKTPALAGEIVRKTVDALDIPVSVKIRAGWDVGSKTAPLVARTAEENGASLVAVHGRTRSQMYTPGVDYEIIAKVKKSLSVPVIANGDIYSGQDALRVLEITGCDGIMIGRGALGNPFIFEEIRCALTGTKYTKPSAEQVIDCAKKHLDLLTKEKGEMGVLEFRKHAAWYTKGMRGASAVRGKMNSAVTKEQMCELFDSLI